MPEFWKPEGESSALAEAPAARETVEARRAALWRHRLCSVADVEAQKQWQESGVASGRGWRLQTGRKRE